VVIRPPGVGAFHFITLAALRATQLMRGCLPRIDGEHSVAVTAQLEVANSKVTCVQATADAPPGPAETAEPSAESTAATHQEG
jgi:hypothetical protein